jgi:hypothetical protein
VNFFSWFRRRPPAMPRDVPVPESAAVDLHLERRLHYLPVSVSSACPRGRTATSKRRPGKSKKGKRR